MSRACGYNDIMIRLAIAGAAGRMGRAIAALAAASDDIEIVCGLVPPLSPQVGSSLSFGEIQIPLRDRLDVECDVLVDVSVPLGTMAWVAFCEHREIPMVIGVTGHSENQLTRIKEAAHLIPLLLAPNFSVGINVLMGLLGRLSAQLGEGYDIEIVEAHHRGKIDSPSGTALRIFTELQRAAGDGLHPVHGRQGSTGPRKSNEIGIHAVRMGDVVGQHEINFSGPGETVTLRHVAHSRDAFAAGALRAARWIVGKGAGFFSMHDVLAQPELSRTGNSPPAAFD